VELGARPGGAILAVLHHHLPGSAMADIQVAGEYIVYSIRTMHQLAGRRISIVGHSQGGMVSRWALRFWPDTRPLVDDLVGLAPSNHGTLDAGPMCDLGCAPAIWQQRNNARFIAALNSGQETLPGISYTVVYTRTGSVVTPNFDTTGSSSPHSGGAAITSGAIQDVCPLDLAEHVSVGTYDKTADPKRVPRSVCVKPLQPGVNPAPFTTDFAAAAAYLTLTLATYPHVAAEPPLACYVTMSCSP
jgi:pimeloyl-ACP methyl ester carboxylesterase